MTADQRLDQLEPFVAQTLAVVDRHTEQLKQLVEIALQHSDNLQFVLQELGEVKQDVGGLKQNVSGLKQDVDELNQGMGRLNDAQKATNVRLDGLDTKLDRILGLLSSK